MIDIRFSFIKHLVVTAECPQCKHESGTDMGACSVDDLTEKVDFFCEEHGTWSVPIDWGAQLNKCITKQ